ncbi:cinnamoyl-CoA reductase 2-like, partial [Primulina huaijiensis]|uniref:cinnamoyl-CoA reductase 2-like n=1 Tax=Primulina huaijiensis TaxID=1492673 RepID=UPI003CC71989
MAKMGENSSVCVTGAGGYIASWLIKLLLSKSYIVHGTVRDSGYFFVFIIFCMTIPPTFLHKFGDMTSLQVELVEPAVKGTLNVLKACSEAKVRRVVFVSSAAAVVMNPNLPKDQLLDETCWSDAEYCKMTNNWYCYSKTVAEIEALEYAKKSGLEVISLCPCHVLGPMLLQKVNASSLVLINLLEGGNEQVVNRFRNVVDVRDVAEALKFVYETPGAESRYICMAHTVSSQGMVEILREMYPNYELLDLGFLRAQT